MLIIDTMEDTDTSSDNDTINDNDNNTLDWRIYCGLQSTYRNSL